MAVVISQIITETAVAPRPESGPAGGDAQRSDDQMELIVRRATERVLETLRREWDR